MGRTKPSATRKRAGTSYIQPAVAAAMSPTSRTMAVVTDDVLTPTRMVASAVAFSLNAPPAAAAARVTTIGPSSRALQDLGRSSLRLGLHDTSTVPGLSDNELPQIESECMVDVSMSVAAIEAAVQDTVAEKVAATESTELTKEEEAVAANAFQEQQSEDESITDTLSFGSSSEEATSPSTAETELDDTPLPAAALTASSSPSRPQSSPLAASPLPHYNTQQQATSSSPIATTRAAIAATPESAPRPPAQERMVMISTAELERWQQRVVSDIEAHFSNEQLKRIAEFGRAHANLLVEAKEYVYNLETQLSAQFDKERADIRVQAEAFVAQAQRENQQLRRTIAELQHEIEMLQLLPSRRSRSTIADDDDEDDEDEDGGSNDEAHNNNDDVEVAVAADVVVANDEDVEEVSSDPSSSSDGSSPGSPDVEVVAVSRKQVRHHGQDDRRKKDKRLLYLGDDNRKLKFNKTRRKAISRHVSVSVDQVSEAG